MLVALLNGLAFSALLLVLSLGLALIFGLRGIVNFAHGGIYMLGAYVGLTISTDVNFWAALVVVPLIFGVVGCLADYLGLRRLADRPQTDSVLLTFGLAFVITALVEKVWGQQGKTLDAPNILSGSVSVLGEVYPKYRLFVAVCSLAAALAVLAWLMTTRTGLHIRAARERRSTASQLGVDVDRVSALVVGAGTALAGVAGVLAGPYLSLSPSMGVDILVMTFIVVVTGGLGSVEGAAAAAFVLGFSISLSATYLPDMSAYVPYAAMLLILLAKPAGLFGKAI